MCLDTLITFTQDKFDHFHVSFGYKVFQSYNKMLLSPLKGNAKKIISENIWMKEIDYRSDYVTDKYLESTDGNKYSCGFHIFEYLNDARNMKREIWNSVIYLVQFKNIVAYGYQNIYLKSSNIIVAKKIKLVQIIKR